MSFRQKSSNIIPYNEQYFRTMSEINYHKQMTSPQNLTNRHGGEPLSPSPNTFQKSTLGVLRSCAIILASPYEISNHVRIPLILLFGLRHDLDMMQVDV